ncbi:MAG: universal stress protein [Actinomycetota bacterium]|nr:universal stress protein [Actinomycetota bacterium]
MFGSILVGTDGSDTATTAVRYAIDLARQLGARLQIFSAYEPVSQQRLLRARC